MVRFLLLRLVGGVNRSSISAAVQYLVGMPLPAPEACRLLAPHQALANGPGAVRPRAHGGRLAHLVGP